MKPVREREARFAGICGISAVVLGLGHIICGSILLGYEVKNGDGLWSGLGIIAIGAIGIAIWWTKFRPAMIIFLMLSAVLAIALVIQTALAVIGFVFWRDFIQMSDNCYIYNGVCRCTTSDGKKLPIPLESCDLIKMFDDAYIALIIFSILSFLVTLAGSFIGCLSTCFDDLKEPKRQLTMTTQPTDLDSEQVDQIQQPESPQQSARQDEITKTTDMKESQVQEKDKKKDEACGNVYEIIVEKVA
ncbi:uncharacterized protein LOC116305634 [Actinia tenebrosa]|uniref:Uncharacterized protein LOC116305634 n=1 Tax=Actinia tenebrosa TaxID=6105 RepID=A0A6P8J0K5_ACTTE|nr:uncharacterized protein LOC116305634 [Actinia tenebrosa]